MATVIPVSESQYLGTLEVLGKCWAGELLPFFYVSGPMRFCSILQVA